MAGKIVAAPTARVWERYGQLRIYVSAGDRQLGWYDPRSGRVQLSDPAMEAEFWSAIRAECQRLVQEGRLASPALPPVPPGTGPPAAPQQSTRKPGTRKPGIREPGIREPGIREPGTRFSVRRGGPPEVAVLGSPRALRRWLAKQPAVLAADQVAAIYQAARQPATWQSRRTRGT